MLWWLLEHDASDDTTLDSGQAATTAPSTPLLVSPRSGDSDHSKPRAASALQAYVDKNADVGTPRRLSYDGGGESVSASFTSYGVSSASPGILESGSSLVPSSGAVLQPVSAGLAVKLESLYSVPNLSSVPSLPTSPMLPSLPRLPSLPVGLVGDDSSVNMWWT